MKRQAQDHELSDHLSGRPTYFHVAGPGVAMNDLLRSRDDASVGMARFELFATTTPAANLTLEILE